MASPATGHNSEQMAGVVANVRLFGPFTADVDGRAVHIRTRPAQSVLARVCLSPSESLSRAQIASDIWPDEEYAVSGNRLRTNLVILKQALAPSDAVKADRSAIWIEDGLLQSDLREANALTRKVRVLQDLDLELQTLTHLLEIIDVPLLEGFEDEWLVPYRDYWIEQRSRNWLRTAQIHQESGRLLDADRAIDKALERDQFNADAWVRRLRVSAQLGKSEEVLARFKAAEGALRRQVDTGFPKEVQSVASRVQRGAIPTAKPHHEFTASEKQILIGALEHMASHDPEGFQRILGSLSFRGQVFRKPFAAFHLILDTLEGSETSMEVKTAVNRSGLVASIYLNEHAEVEKLCGWIIDNCPENGVDHIIALHQLSFIRFEQRNWDSAYSLAHRALELARREQPSQIQLVLANLASFDLHMGKLDEAEKAYLDALEFYSDENDLRSRHNFAVISWNLGYAKAVAQDWQGASAYALDAWRRTAVDGFEPLRASVGPLLGFTRVVLGSRDGVKLILDGLNEAYRNRSTRYVEIGMDYAAGALACLGDGGNAVAALDAVARLRGTRCHHRSIAEERFASFVRAQAGDPASIPQWPESESLLDCLMRVDAALEAQAERS